MVVIEDESLRSESIGLVARLRGTGRAVEYALTPTKADKQVKRALELGANETVRLEKGENGALTLRLRRLSTREEAVMSGLEAGRYFGWE